MALPLLIRVGFNDLNDGVYEGVGIGGFSTVASATTPDIFAATVSGVINYTGTTTCTGFTAAPAAGARRVLVCAGAAVFTAGANMLIDGVTSVANLTCAAGDKVHVIAVTTTQFRLTNLPYAGISTIFSKSYASAQQTISQAGGLTLAHGLGAVPTLVTMELVCTYAGGEAGYAQNQVVQLPAIDYTSSQGVSTIKDATNLTIRFGNNANVFSIPHATTGTATTLTNSKWAPVFRAWA